jgi:uncharacterized BrkB/YihY/UPF0761 family membrane protein
MSLLLFYASVIMGNQLDIIGQLIPLSGRIAFWADSLMDAMAVSLILMVLYYIYSNRTIDFIPTLVVALLSGIILKGVGTLGVAIIQSMTRRISIFGAMATPIMFMMYLRLFAEILIFSSLIVDFFFLPAVQRVRTRCSPSFHRRRMDPGGSCPGLSCSSGGHA